MSKSEGSDGSDEQNDRDALNLDDRDDVRTENSGTRSSGKKTGSEDAEIEKVSTPLVLEPDHPMMQRFQIALKNHLQKQIDKVTNQAQELDNEIKQKEKEKEETGLELYTVQQEVYRQQKILEDCESTIENLMKERQMIDESVRAKKINWKEEVNRLNCAKKNEMNMIAELQRLSSLEKQMEKWEKEMESELTVSQRISEKTAHDKNKLVEEKRKMDMYLLRLMTTVSNYESEIRLLEGEIDVKVEEKDALSQTVADATADLQALITEQKRLMSAWNSVVAMINQKNNIYSNASDELTKYQNAFQSLNTEIESYKRSCAEEMKKSEKLALIYGRFECDFQTCDITLKTLTEKKRVLEDNISSTAAMINRTEAEHQHVKAERERIEVALNGVRSGYEKLCEENRRLEDESMNLIQEQIFNDKSATHLNKLLKDMREKNRKQEFGLLETENKISQKFLETEELKEIISRNNEIINEMNKELRLKEDELKKFEEEIEKCETAVFQKQGHFATLTRKIEKYLEKTNYGKAWMSPTQQRILDLEKTNAEIQGKNDKLQSLWLLQQNNNLKLTQQRNEQLKDIALLRKQVSLLLQKVLKGKLEYEKEKKIEHNIDKSIGQLQRKLVSLNEVFASKKDYRENLGKENSLTQAQYIQNLKESEKEQIRLKDEIKDLESNLEELAETMLETQREMLAWERKIQSAVEAKNDMQKQRSSSGEIGQMKAEIHRMEVRYGQLKRAQEKLITDLEQCVFRRDAILDGADAREKRQTKGCNTRFAFQKKLETLRNNIRAVRNERKQMQKVIENTREGHEQLNKVICEKEVHLTNMKETTKKMDKQLEEGKLRKCQNLEMLIRRQKKCKLYELLKSGKHRMLFKSENTLENELQKVKTKNSNLISVMEALIEDFPGYHFHLKKICNTFEAKPS